MKVYYLHTLNGRPAHFCSRLGRLVPATPGGFVRRGQPLAETLKQVKKEQAAHDKNTADAPPYDYLHYVRMSCPV